MEQQQLEMRELEKVFQDLINNNKNNDFEKIQMSELLEKRRFEICNLNLKINYLENNLQNYINKYKSIKLSKEFNFNLNINEIIEEKSIIKSSYLQKILIEFFIQDNNTKIHLIPAILKIVDCPDYLIDKAIKNCENSIKSKNFFW